MTAASSPPLITTPAGGFVQSVDTITPDNTLFVIAVISNPVGFKSRYELYRKFEQHVSTQPIKLITVELALRDRSFEITDPGNPFDIQVRGTDELWHKENLINIALARLPHNAKYVAWVDADIEFYRKDWAAATIHALQHHQVVQLWESAIDLGPAGEAMQTHTSFGSMYAKGAPNQSNSYTYWHPGFAWAARREALDNLGGLVEQCILGAGDHHMALAFVGGVERSFPPSIPEAYKHALHAWQDRAEHFIRRDLGFVPGTILHNWHGRKAKRKYNERWSILIKHAFDPIHDIKRNMQGVLHLTHNKIDLRDDIRRYFRQRNEDGIDND